MSDECICHFVCCQRINPPQRINFPFKILTNPPGTVRSEKYLENGGILEGILCVDNGVQRLLLVERSCPL